MLNDGMHIFLILLFISGMLYHRQGGDGIHPYFGIPAICLLVYGWMTDPYASLYLGQ